MPTPVTRSKQASFPRKGSLKRVAFPQLVFDIASSKTSGSLYLLSGETKKIVVFRDGCPKFVRSNLAEECLGQVLAEQGIITQKQCNDTLEALRRTGKRQGELLVERGILSRGNLEYGLRAQLETKLFEIFSWQQGRFQFKEGASEQEEEGQLEGSVSLLVTRAIQERFTDERARSMLSDNLKKFPRKSRTKVNPDELGLLPEEAYFLTCLDGSRTTEDILNGDKVDPPVPRISTLLYALQVTGAIEFSAFKRTSMPRAKPPTIVLKNPDDTALAPDYEQLEPISEFEDTPLPGELPAATSNTGLPTLRSEDEEMFADVAASADEDSAVLDAQELAQASVSLASATATATKRPASPSPLGTLVDDDDDDLDLADGSDSQEHTIVDEVFASEDIELVDDDLIEEVSSIQELADDDELDELSAVLETPGDDEVLDGEALTTLDPDVTLEGLREQAELADGDLPELGDDLPELGDLDATDLGDLDATDLGDLDATDLGDLDATDLDAADLDATDLGDLDAADLDAADLGDIAADLEDIAEDLGDIDADLADLDVGDLGDIDADLADFDPDDIDLDAVDLDELAADAEELEEPAVELDDDLLLEDAELIADDDIDLGDEDFDNIELDAGELDDDHIAAAMRFHEGEAAMKASDYATALDRFAEAFDLGLDVAELRAMAAFARFRNNGGDETTAQESLEQLDYAEQLDAELDLVHAYRGAIYLGLGIHDSARESFERALQINPYCELAIEYINNV